MAAVRLTSRKLRLSFGRLTGIAAGAFGGEIILNELTIFGQKDHCCRFGTLLTSSSEHIQHVEKSRSLRLNRNFLSTSASPLLDDNDGDGPGGDLFNAPIGLELVGKTANIRRTFGSRSNAQCFLVCGGEALAKHASFDPDYGRAQGWIRHHAVGPAVLSPVLICGLVGALVEAALPQSVPMSSSMKQIRPLIVGVEIFAKIEVTNVHPDAARTADCDNGDNSGESTEHGDQNDRHRQHGYQIELKTLVSRVQDGVAIAEGRNYVWIPDYLHM